MREDPVGEGSFHDKQNQGTWKFFQRRLLARVINSKTEFEPFYLSGSGWTNVF